MKSTNYSLIRYDADENCVFDWKEPRYEDVIDEDGEPTGEQTQMHLNVKTLFIGSTDDITNYVEVDAEGNITELEADLATVADYQVALAELGVE